MVEFAGFADEAGKSVEEQIRATLEAGWSAVEVRNADGVNCTDMPQRVFDRSLPKIERAGIMIAGKARAVERVSKPGEGAGYGTSKAATAVPQGRG
jgi:hypothetical protein